MSKYHRRKKKFFYGEGKERKKCNKMMMRISSVYHQSSLCDKRSNR